MTGGDWAVPGSAEDQPLSAGPAPATIGEADGAGRVVRPAGRDDVAAGASVPEIALRPMTVADVLDGGFAVVKARPRRIIGLTAALVVPAQLVLAAIQRTATVDTSVVEFFGDPTVANEQTSGGELADQYLAMAATIVIQGLVLVFLAAAIAHLVGQWVMGRDAPAGEMMGAAVRRGWPLFASFFVVKAAELVGAFGCYVGVLFVMPLFVAVAPVIAVEGCGGWQAVTRSVRLTSPRYFPTMGAAVLMGLVATLLVTALSALPQALALAIGGDAEWPLLALGNIAASVVVTPFVAAATVLLYFDLRVRTEGLDLEMATTDVFGRAR